MIEVVGTYVLFLAMYPIAIATYAAEAPGQFVGWFAIGLAAVLLLRRWCPLAVKLWIALWFMPGTIICGAATLLPLPFAVWAAFNPGRCATVASLLECLALNNVFVFGITSLFRKLRRMRATHNKPLQPIAREDARSG
jgi:hypothetical protein